MARRFQSGAMDGAQGIPAWSTVIEAPSPAGSASQASSSQRRPERNGNSQTSYKPTERNNPSPAEVTWAPTGGSSNGNVGAGKRKRRSPSVTAISPASRLSHHSDWDSRRQDSAQHRPSGDLEADLFEQKKAVERAEKSLADARAEIKRLKDQQSISSFVKQENDTLKASNNRLQTENTRLLNKVDNLEEREREVKRMNNDHIAELTNNIHDLTNDLVNLQEQLRSLPAKPSPGPSNSSSSNIVKQLETQLRSMQAQAKRDNADLERLHSTIEDLESRLAQSPIAAQDSPYPRITNPDLVSQRASLESREKRFAEKMEMLRKEQRALAAGRRKLVTDREGLECEDMLRLRGVEEMYGMARGLAETLRGHLDRGVGEEETEETSGSPVGMDQDNVERNSRGVHIVLDD